MMIWASMALFAGWVVWSIFFVSLDQPTATAYSQNDAVNGAVVAPVPTPRGG